METAKKGPNGGRPRNEKQRTRPRRARSKRSLRTTENNSADAGGKKAQIPANKCRLDTARSSGATKEGSKRKKEVRGPKTEHREAGPKGEKRKKDLERRKQTFAMHHERRKEGRDRKNSKERNGGKRERSKGETSRPDTEDRGNLQYYTNSINKCNIIQIQ